MRSDDLEKNSDQEEPFLAIPNVGRDVEQTSRQPQQGDDSLSNASSKRSRSSTILVLKALFVLAVVCVSSYQVASLWMIKASSSSSSSSALTLSPSSLVLSVEEDEPLSWLGKKWKPGKKCHHGRVVYKTTDIPGQGRIYTREFTSACAHGILVFQIGAAHDYLPYEFDIYHDEYAYSDNGGMCLLLPSYKGVESRKGEPYWNPQDPTEIIVDFNTMTKISTVIPKIQDGKPLNDAATSRCGDYVVMMKGNFYSASFFQNLKHRINTWKVDETIEDIFAEVMAETTAAAAAAAAAAASTAVV